MKNNTDNDQTPSQESSNSRRDFLKKAGRFAVYTPPAIMMLMKPGFAESNQKGSWMGRPDQSSWRPRHSDNENHRPQNSWKPPQHSWNAR